MGEVVKRVDSTFVPCLRETLKYEARHRKFQALEICSTLNLVEQIEDDLLELLETTDQGLKSQVCRTLGHSRTPEAEVALHRAMTDTSTEVRAAAQEALATFEESLTDQPSVGRQDSQAPVMTESTS